MIDVDEVSDAYDVIDVVDLTNDERALDDMLDNQVTPPTNFIASRDQVYKIPKVSIQKRTRVVHI